MLRRNAVAIVWWDVNHRYLGSESDYPMVEIQETRPPPLGLEPGLSLYPPHMNNGILDLTLLNFPNHSVIPMNATF